MSRFDDIRHAEASNRRSRSVSKYASNPYSFDFIASFQRRRVLSSKNNVSLLYLQKYRQNWMKIQTVSIVSVLEFSIMLQDS